MVRCEYDRQFVPAISMPASCAHTAGARQLKDAIMNRWNVLSDDIRRARLELIKTLHRTSLLEREEREEREVAALKPLLREDIDASWDTPSRSR